MHVNVSVCVFDDERVCVCDCLCVSVREHVCFCCSFGAVVCACGCSFVSACLCYKVEESGHSVLFNIGLAQSQARFFSNPSHT